MKTKHKAKRKPAGVYVGRPYYREDLPKCDDCGKNDRVDLVGPGTHGAEFYCRRCKAGWAQSW